MKISKLLENVSGITPASPSVLQTEIKNIETDSRKISAGDLFVALDGARMKGSAFISHALSNGAAAAIAPSGVELPREGIPPEKIIYAEDIAAALAAISSNFRGNPSSKMQVVGVTGTNGKTTFTYLFEAMSSRVKKTGVIGTVNYRYDGKIFPAPNTTPFAHDLAALMAAMKSRGVAVAVMEVSSHSLAQRRVDGVEFDCCVFTNLTQDHLDFHRDMEHYFEAKKRLFAELLEKSPKKNKSCVINIDDEWGKKMAASAPPSARLITCSMNGPADARVTSMNMTPRGASFSCEIFGRRHEFETHLIGRYNVSNAFLSAVAALASGIPEADVRKGLALVKRIPGRMESFDSKKGFTVVVHYAHTPDALSKVIGALKDIGPSRLITVFGCGGDRDRTKRPLMGAVAVSSSDMVVVTSDNPRTEDPHKIILDIEIGIKKTGASNYSIIIDRKEAIYFALSAARTGDIVLLAGKGHEAYQIIGDAKIPFSDYDTARAAVKNIL